MLTIAHRGSMARALQNSPAGIRVALDQGAGAVELDVTIDREGSLVCAHGLGRASALAECLAALEGRSDLIVHLKGAWSGPDLRRLFDEIRVHLPLERVTFAAHRGGVLQRIRSIEPRARLARFGLIPALLALWKRPVWETALINQVVLCRPLVRALRSRGFAVHASCIWEFLPRDSVARLGVDGAFVNLHP